MHKHFDPKNEQNVTSLREVREEELVQTEGGGWFSDAVDWLRHDVLGVPEGCNCEVAAGTRA